MFVKLHIGFASKYFIDNISICSFTFIMLLLL